MDAGIPMDAMIARRVWQAIVVHDPATGEAHLVEARDRTPVPLPRYSTVVEDAHRVSNSMQKRGYSLHVKHAPERGQWLAAFVKEDGRVYTFSSGTTMPHAICEAALAALDGKNLAGKRA